ncbi:hypothetical protein OF83DRAFT_1200501 [Amylostereum chailletii]|nr:hypothetical protein OF83DRAFT_1200501 [Amylostereum chailletii]
MQPADVPFKALWDRAKDEYTKVTGIDLSTKSISQELENCASVDDVLTAVEEQVTIFRGFRKDDSRWEKLRKVLKPVVHVVSTLSEALGEGVSLAFPAGQTIFVAISVLLAATKGVSSSYDSLTDLFDVLKAFLRRLEIRKDIALSPESKTGEIAVKILAQLLSVLALATSLIKRKRFKQYVKVLTGNQDVKDALNALDKLTAEESGLIATETFVATHKVLKFINAMMSDKEASDRHLKSILAQLDLIAKSVSASEEYARRASFQLNAISDSQLVIQQTQTEIKDQCIDERILRWLSPPRPSTNHNSALELRHPGTGDWFLCGDDFEGWKNMALSFLWIHGKPGSGKTVLCSAIIEELKLVPNARVLYFYFDFRDPEKHRARGLLASLLDQLAYFSPGCASLLRDLYERCHDGREQPSTSALTECLENMLSTCGEVFVIWDALDECPAHPERAEVLQIINNLINWKRWGLHICVTSRPEIDIKEHLASLATHQLNLHLADQQGRDIESYIKHVFQHDPAFRSWKAEDKELAIQTLSQHANGMFRWVFCQIDALRNCLPMDIRRTLQDLPKTLNETYQRILQNIKKSFSSHALRLFQCLAFSERPLHILELVDVLSVDFHSGPIPTFDPSYRPLEAEVLRICSSLVVLDTETGIVQFAHFSVQEYMLSEDLSSTEGVSFYHIDALQSHTILAQVCLSMLIYNSAVDGAGHEEAGVYFIQYAAVHWFTHVQYESVADDITVEVMMEMLFHPQNSLLSRFDPHAGPVDEQEDERAFSDLPELFPPSYSNISQFLQREVMSWRLSLIATLPFPSQLVSLAYVSVFVVPWIYAIYSSFYNPSPFGFTPQGLLLSRNDDNAFISTY